MIGGRGLDHVGLLVADTDAAVAYFSRIMGLVVVEQEELEVPPVRLTHLGPGPVTIQLVEPLEGNDALRTALETDGEGLHHLCFAVDDLLPAIRELSGGQDPTLVIEGRHRRSAFVPGSTVHGLRVELTEQR